MKDTEYRPEPLENPDIAQEDIPETPAEAEAMPVVLPDLSESRPVVTGELMEGPEAVPEDREVVLTYLQDPPREVVEYYLHKARLPRQGDAPAPAPAGSIDRQLAQAAEGKPEPPAPKRPGRRRRRRAILITLGILLLVAVIAVLVFHFTRSDAPDESREPYPGYEQTATDQAITIPSCRARKDLRVELAAGHGEALTAEEVYARVNPATVTVVCDVSDTSASVGTGVIITADGYVLTNHHVVAGGRNCTVTLSDNVQYEAKYVVSDEVNDLAVLKIVDARDLPTAELGDSSLLTVGETVYAIGNPLGVELRGTFTDGLVSALDRDVDVDGRTMTLIQTNAALNSGNSGGPLINQYGQVVGINTIKMMSEFSNIEGLGFAIPTQAIRRVVNTWNIGKVIPMSPGE
ncbi:MAG: trypsin-like peptidase domain-containing protein [Dysosmobacter sp.]|nr:trypsin-like peptidase domain-containing protein [Dysosmobacter sp.]